MAITDPPDDAVDLMTELAQLLPDYEWKRAIGKGGMGSVFLAWQPKLQRHVVIKVMEVAGAKGEELAARFQREARVLARLTHPRIPVVHDYGQAANLLYYVSEHVDGCDLAAKLHKGPIGIDEAVRITKEVAEALGAAHGEGIIHRDVKPANILLDQDGQVKLADFGLSKPGVDLDHYQSNTDVVMGTPLYMAPEQWTAPDTVDARTDIYALGKVLYQMLTGQLPAGLLKPPSQSADIDERFDAFIDQCLQPSPSDRYPDMETFIAALDASARNATAPPAKSTATAQKQSRVLLYAELTNPLDLQRTLGPDGFVGLLEKRENRLQDACGRLGVNPQRLHADAGGMTLAFGSASDAVGLALVLQESANEEAALRVGLHQGEVLILPNAQGEFSKAVGLALDTVKQVARLGVPSQILMTRGLFDDARQSIREFPLPRSSQSRELSWQAHGAFNLESADAPLAIFEVGLAGVAPQVRPAGGRGEEILGWRPAAGLVIPHREGWELVCQLGSGAFGEVWLAENDTLNERRVFKFCFDEDKLRSLKRELILVRVLRDTLGKRQDIASLHEVQLSESPYFLESEYYSEGNLQQWTEKQGGLEEMAIEDRLAIIRQVAHATAAAHSVGVIHKDIKPSNIFMKGMSTDRAVPVLGDFGIGALENKEQLEGIDLTYSETLVAPSSDTVHGSLPYMAPELHGGERATVRSDVYALGVLLYKLAAGSFARQVGQGWERDIDDPLLREDIAACVEANPKRRLANAETLADRLERLPERRAEAERKKRLARRAALSKRLMTGSVAALLLLGGWLFLENRQTAKAFEKEEWLRGEAETARELAKHVSSRADTQYASHLAGEYDPFYQPEPDRGVGLFVRALASDQDNRLAKAQLLETLLNTDLAIPIWYDRTAHPEKVHAMDATPDMSLLASISEWGQSLRVWKREDRQVSLRYKSPQLHRQPIAVKFADDGQTLYECSRRYPIARWNLATGELPTPLEVPNRLDKEAVFKAVFSESGRYLAFGTRIGRTTQGRNYMVDFKQPDPVALIRPLDFEGVLLGLAIDSKETRLACARHDGRIYIRPLPGSSARRLEIPPQYEDGRVLQLAGLAFSRCGTVLIAAAHNGNGAMLRFDLETGEEIGKKRMYHSLPKTVRMMADGSRFMTGSTSRHLKNWTWVDGRHHVPPVGKPFGHDALIWELTSGELAYLGASGSGDATARVWTVNSQETVGGPLRHRGEVSALKMSANERLLATGSSVGEMALWDIASKRQHAVPFGYEGRVEKVLALSHSRVVTIADSGEIVVWKNDGGALERIHTLQHSGSADFVECGENLDWLLAASFSSEASPALNLWRLDQPGHPQVSEDVPSGLTSAAVHPIGKRFAIGTQDGRFSTWSLETGQRIHQGSLPEGDVATAMHFTHDGKLLVGTRQGALRGYAGDLAMPTFARHDAYNAEVLEIQSAHGVEWFASLGYSVPGTYEKQVRRWRLTDGEALPSLKNKDDRVSCFKLLSDGRVVIGTEYSRLGLWDGESATLLGDQMEIFEGKITAIHVGSQEKSVMAKADHKASLTCWDLESGHLVWRRNTSPRAFDLAPDDRTFVFADWTIGQPFITVVPTTDTQIDLHALSDLGEALSGYSRSSESSNLITVSWEQRLALLEEYRNHPDPLIRWLASPLDPNRSVSPVSTLNAEDYVKLVCQLGTPEFGDPVLRLASLEGGRDMAEHVLGFAERFIEMPGIGEGGRENYFGWLLTRAVRLDPQEATLAKAIQIAERGLAAGLRKEPELVAVLERAAGKRSF